MNAREILPTDPLLLAIADYVEDQTIASPAAFDAARHCLLDSLACALESLEHPACVRLLGPVVPGASVTHGARVPGTVFLLDPVKAAFDIGCMVRWLDLSDTWTATQTTHPSDDMGAILAVADYLSRANVAGGRAALTMGAVLEAMIRAHEIQGGLGSAVSLQAHGIDNVFLTRVAAAAVVARLLGGTREQIVAAASLAFFEPSLCVHRFGSNTGPRKGWAGADAASHAVRLAMMAVRGEPGYPQVLTHPQWGLNARFLGGEGMRLPAGMGSEVMEGVIYKLWPAVIHAQSAVECALELHAAVRERLGDIAEIRIASHQQPMFKINKTGPLRNPADRDHCLQYSVAVALLHGRLQAHDYEDAIAADPRIDRLRALMTLREEPRFTAKYLDPSLRANPHAMEILFRDGTRAGPVQIEYPAGHPRRRKEGMPLLIAKFEAALERRFPPERRALISALCLDHERLMHTPVSGFTDMFAA